MIRCRRLVDLLDGQRISGSVSAPVQQYASCTSQIHFSIAAESSNPAVTRASIARQINYPVALSSDFGVASCSEELSTRHRTAPSIFSGTAINPVYIHRLGQAIVDRLAHRGWSGFAILRFSGRQLIRKGFPKPGIFRPPSAEGQLGAHRGAAENP